MNVFKNGKLVIIKKNGKDHTIAKKPTTPPTDIQVANVTITNKISSLTQGLTHQLQVNVLPSDATNKTLTYSSSNTSIATVTTTGLITATATGSCTITVKSSSNISDTMSLTVNAEEPPITVLENELPYISTYYYNPKPYHDEEVIVPIYITDYNESEYVLDDTSKKFRLKIDVDGNVSYKENLQAGDHNINLGVLSEGEHIFTMQAIDEYDRISHQLVNEVYVVNRQTYPITLSQTYTITDADLAKHNINKNNSEVEQDMINNRVGLSALFKEIKANAYRKCILPQGTYRVNRAIRMGSGTETPVDIPSQFTVDFNNSVLKLHPYEDSMYNPEGRVENLMIRFLNCFDSHVINYIFDGDYAEREANGWMKPVQGNANGEHSNCFAFYGGKYNSVEDGVMRNIVGYSHVTSYGSGYGNPIWTGDWVDNISLENGVELSKDGKTTCGFYDISRFLSEKVISVSVFSAAGGLKGKSYFIDIHFYDSNKNYIGSTKAMQYRWCKIPADSKFVRVTATGTKDELNSIFIHSQPTPRYCSVINMEAMDNRTCLAPSAFTHLLYDNINFTRSGYSVTPACIDLEDGWENGQDFYMKSCEVKEKVGTVDFIDCGGLNHVIENCIGFSIEPRHRVYGMVIKNNPDIKMYLPRLGWNDRARAWRTYGNTFKDSSCDSTPMAKPEDNGYVLVIRDCNFTNYNVSFKDNYSVKLFNCDFIDLKTNDCYIEKCNISRNTKSAPVSWDKVYIGKGTFNNCIFTHTENTTAMQFDFNIDNSNRKFEDCTFEKTTYLYDHNNFNDGYWNNCDFNGLVKLWASKTNTKGQLVFNSCTFKELIDISLGNSTYVQFNDCTFEKGKTFVGTSQERSEFNNCIG